MEKENKWFKSEFDKGTFIGFLFGCLVSFSALIICEFIF